MKSTKKIIQYLDGELKGQELLDFKTQIRANEELSKLIVLHKEVNESILDEDAVNFRKKIVKLYSSYNKKQNKSRTFKIKRVMEFAAAASILFIVSFGIHKFYSIKNSSAKIYNTNYHPYDSDIITRSKIEGDNGLNMAIYLYQKKDYKSAFELFNNYLKLNRKNPIANFYFGITAMELENYNVAVDHLQFVINDTTNLYKVHAQWYLTLCYLEQENIKSAKKQLYELIKTDSQYKLKAQKILKKIN